MFEHFEQRKCAIRERICRQKFFRSILTVKAFVVLISQSDSTRSWWHNAEKVCQEFHIEWFNTSVIHTPTSIACLLPVTVIHWRQSTSGLRPETTATHFSISQNDFFFGLKKAQIAICFDAVGSLWNGSYTIIKVKFNKSPGKILKP